ncbi:MAG: dihydrofolate reductase family protein [Saprospiraceae bacterium]|nr:dihydrofolate reductase family protein [Saprospiraceae bacterium]
MRKLKLQVQMTLDGFISGVNGEMDWMTFPWTKDIEEYVGEITGSVDTILLGRKLAEGFIPHWSKVAVNPKDPEHSAGQKFTDTHKVVFTKTLKKSDPAVAGWTHTELAEGDLIDEVNAWKQRDGNDIISYGGGTFVSALIKSGLIDEYHLFVNPVVIGTGMPIFKEIGAMQHLDLVKSQAFECGIVLLHYVVNREEKKEFEKKENL